MNDLICLDNLPLHREREIRGYQAGETTGPNQMFRPRRASADADIRRGLRVTVDRCRDQLINNPSIRGAVRRICNNVIRDGIAPRFLFRDPADPDQLDTAANKAWRTLFDRWAARAGRNGQSYWTMQRLILSAMYSDGECYLHRYWDIPPAPDIPPLRLELIERDQLDLNVDGRLANGNTARQGKEYDSAGNIVAYHLLQYHPGDNLRGYEPRDPVRVPATEIIDVHDTDRISQHAGMPWLASLVMESYDLQEYRDYERIGAKLAAAFGIFVRNNNPTANPLGGIGVIHNSPADLWPGAWQQHVPPLSDYIEPGRIQALPYGTDIVVASHNRPGSQYPVFVKESRRTQSTGLGISYEAYANDYTDASYSSARSGALEERLTYQGIQFFLSESLLDPVCRWFLEAVWLWNGLAPSPLPAGQPADWHVFVQQYPGWQWVDPVNDANASVIRITNGLSSKGREMAMQGLDLDEINDERLSEIRKEKAILQAQLENARLAAEIAALQAQTATPATTTTAKGEFANAGLERPEK